MEMPHQRRPTWQVTDVLLFGVGTRQKKITDSKVTDFMQLQNLIELVHRVVVTLNMFSADYLKLHLRTLYSDHCVSNKCGKKLK